MTDAQIIYVNTSPSGLSDGSSWDNATNNLKGVLDTATYGVEIWVAEGIYTPDSTDRAASFIIPNGVRILGGFKGNEALAKDRDWQRNKTILSGDINNIIDQTDNSYSVVSTFSANHETIFDGFTISGGYANGTTNMSDSRAGGWYNDGQNGTSNPTIRNTIFENNYSMANGGAMYNFGTSGIASPTYNNCIFRNNSSEDSAGAVFNDGSYGESSPLFLRCTIENNSVNGVGGGIYNYAISGQSNSVFVNCIIQDNYAGYAGGGIYTLSKLEETEANIQITNCLFLNNESAAGGGAIYSLASDTGICSPIITNCTFYGNHSHTGGAMYSNASDGQTGNCSPIVSNSIFWNNTSNYEGPIRNNYASPYFEYTLIDVEDCDALLNGPGAQTSCNSPSMIFNQYPNFKDTVNFDLNLLENSIAINKGSKSALPLDWYDLDEDSDTAESLSLDLIDSTRIQLEIVDLGAYEAKELDTITCRINDIIIGEQSLCDVTNNLYTQTIIVYYDNPDGDLIINGENYTTTESPQVIVLDSLSANNLTVLVEAAFENDADCSFRTSFQAPTPCLCQMIAINTIEIVSGNVAKINWTSSSNATKYRLRYRTLTGLWIEKSTQGSENFRFLNQLMPNTDYQIQLKSLCSNSNTTWSSSSYFTTSSDSCDYPESTDFTKIMSTTTMDWANDIDDLKYKIKYRKISEGNPWIEFISNTNSKQLSLHQNSEYKFKIKTKCALGWTNWSPNFYYTSPNKFTIENSDLVADDDIELRTSVYPNPTTDKISIDINSYKNQQVQMIDLNGKLVWEDTVENQTTIDIQHLPNGIYFIKTQLNEKIHTTRFIKM